jgi:hypothetical protein
MRLERFLASGVRHKAPVNFYAMNEENEPDWLAELAKGGEAVRRQVEPIVQAAEQFVRDARRAKTSGGPALPFAQRVALAVDAGLRELLPARMDADVRPVTLEVSIAFPTPIIFTGTVALTPLRVSGRLAAEDPRGGHAERSIGQILAIVLVVIATWRLLVVPEQDRAAVDHYLSVIGFGLTIALLIWNKQNKSN